MHSIEERRAPTVHRLLDEVAAVEPSRHLALLDLPTTADPASLRQQLRRKGFVTVVTIGTTDPARFRRYIIAAPIEAEDGWERIGRRPPATLIERQRIVGVLARIIFDPSATCTWPGLAGAERAPSGGGGFMILPWTDEEKGERDRVMAVLGPEARRGDLSRADFLARFKAALSDLRSAL